MVNDWQYRMVTPETLVVEAYRLGKYDNATCFSGTVGTQLVVEAYRLGKYDNIWKC